MTKVMIYRRIRDDLEDDEFGVQRQEEDRRALAASMASRSSGRRSTPTSAPRHPGAGEDPPACGEMFARARARAGSSRTSSLIRTFASHDECLSSKTRSG